MALPIRGDAASCTPVAASGLLVAGLMSGTTPNHSGRRTADLQRRFFVVRGRSGEGSFCSPHRHVAGNKATSMGRWREALPPYDVVSFPSQPQGRGCVSLTDNVRAYLSPHRAPRAMRCDDQAAKPSADPVDLDIP